MDTKTPKEDEPARAPDGVEEESEGPASLLGKYNDDPSWEEFPEFLKQYRKQIDELNKDS